MDPLEAQIRQVFFFDTPDLAARHGGPRRPARRVQGKGDDTVVKLRPVVPGELPEVAAQNPGFGVEVDAMPGGFVCSASMKGALRRAQSRRRSPRASRLRKLFTKEQRALFASTPRRA